MKQAREQWETDSHSWEASRIVCLDESNIKTSMVRLYGRGREGMRVRGYIPDARWKSLSIVSSLRFDGSTEALIYEGGMTSELFRKWVKDCLIKTLHKGDILILDNMSSHKSIEIQELVESVGATMKYLPPYSPDKNPIELMWSKVKAELRKAEEVTPEGLTEETGRVLSHITQTDARGWFCHCGYYS